VSELYDDVIAVLHLNCCTVQYCLFGDVPQSPGGVGDLGCAHLATLSNLTSLNLSQNEEITNRGAASIAVLSNLKALNLSKTRVDSGGLLRNS